MDRDQYESWRRDVDVDDVAIVTGGISLLGPDEIDEGQEGYAGEGWPEHWLVIGNETSMGDPIVLDMQSGKVLRAVHGQGDWDSYDDIADSLDGFVAILNAVRPLSEGRDSMDADPVPREELDRFLEEVKKANPDLDPWWWVSEIYGGEEPPESDQDAG